MEAIAKGQITISILDKGDKGNDAEFYKLNPLIELAAVDKDGKLGVSLKYNIQHIVGANITNINADTYYVRFRPNIATVNTNLSTNTTTPFYNNASYQTDYYKQSSKITYFIIELIKGEQILDSRIVTVTLLPSATFDIKQATDKEVASIKSRVTANETKIANNTKQITNNYSVLNQKADSIQTQVISNKTAINNVTGKININTTNISTLTQKANEIESRVGKIETSGENIVNDKQFFIYSDNQPYQSREYDITTDTYTFKCSSKSNDIDYNSDFIKLDAGKYMLSFVPTVNGNDVRMLLQVSLYSDASGSNARDNQVVKYSDIPQHKLYTYEFTVTKDRPYLQLYLESSAQNNQTTLPWIVKLQNVRLLKIKESESLIKQTVDNIELKVKNTGINIEDGTITLNADKTNVNGNLHIKGQIRKGIINIGQFNLSNYIKVEDSTNFLQLEKTGGLIIFDGYFFTDIGICLVPSLYPEQYNLSESYKNYVRSFVGQTVLIYNKSNKTMAFTGALTTPELIDIDNFNSIEVNPNEFISMECKCGVAKNGLEKVYWVYQKGKSL